MPEADQKAPARPARPARPPSFKVRAHNPDDYVNPGKVIKDFPTETLARNYIVAHHPRGREVYLDLPNGDKEHYSADLAVQGDDPWIEYGEHEDY
jgi:hypothetical protein